MSNVLSLVPYKIFPAKLGGQKGIAFFNHHLSKHHNLFCITVKDNDPSFADYTVMNVLSNSRFRYVNLFYLFTICRIIRKHSISHIIVEHPYYGWLALLIKGFCGVKLIIHSHNIEAHRFRSIGKWWWKILLVYEQFVHRHASFTFCITAEDRKYMIEKFRLKPDRCMVITYGIDWKAPPAPSLQVQARAILNELYQFPDSCVLFMFNGTLSYLPNLKAVKMILEDINPLLLATDMNYRIIICGKGLPRHVNITAYSSRHIIYAGFVDDISVYFNGVDVFINPVAEGGGIKTKLVEAMAHDLNAVSNTAGAIGVDPLICNGKLLLSGNDCEQFVSKMKLAATIPNRINNEFFDHFYWENIAAKAAAVIG
jgi:glycosyltransferase involved in cell wall biosynthesis